MTPDGAVVDLRVDLTGPGNELRVTTRVERPGSGPVRVTMPRWTPGSYLLREFARHVEAVTARRGGSPVGVHVTGVDEWTVDPGEGDLELTHVLHANDLSVRTNYRSDQRALVCWAATALVPEGRESGPFRVTVEQPAHWPEPQCALPLVDGRHVASDLDALVDAPLAAGPCRLADFEVAGVPHRIALYGEGDCDLETLVPDVQATCEAAAAVFGGGVPSDRYLFIFELGCGGGLEHASSSVCGFPVPGFATEAERRRRLALVAHEYFHVWNVKRIRPEALGPFDYRAEVLTPHLWVAEGLTNYYEHRLGLDAGLVSPGRYLNILAWYLADWEQTPGKDVQSLEDSSRCAWIKLYRPTENTRNSQVSYYSVGALVGLVLDLEIRLRTAGERSLDDAFRSLWRLHLSRPERGFSDDELRAALAEAAGESLAEVLDECVRQPGAMDVVGRLEAAGLTVERLPREEQPAWIGVELETSGARTVFRRIVRDGPAWRAGVLPGEELLAIDGFRVGDDPAPWLKRRQPGESVRLTTVLEGRLRDVSVTLDATPSLDLRLRKAERVDGRGAAALSSWLGVAREELELLDEAPEDQRPLRKERRL